MAVKSAFNPEVRAECARVAMEVFRRNGFAATGIDTIIDRLSISKATFYRYYRSKDELIAAVLDLEYEDLESQLGDVARQVAPDPVARVMGIFQAFAGQAEAGRFAGALCRRAADEFRDRDAALEACAGRYFGRVSRAFQSACAQAGHADPVRGAEYLTLLFQGAAIAAQIRQAGDPFQAALTPALCVLGWRGDVAA